MNSILAERFTDGNTEVSRWTFLNVVRWHVTVSDVGGRLYGLLLGHKKLFRVGVGFVTSLKGVPHPWYCYQERVNGTTISLWRFRIGFAGPR